MEWSNLMTLLLLQKGWNKFKFPGLEITFQTSWVECLNLIFFLTESLKNLFTINFEIVRLNPNLFLFAKK